MSSLDRLVLKVKRRDGTAAAALHDAYRWLLRWNLPDSTLLRRLGRLAYSAHDTFGLTTELLASKLLYEPMVRGRFAHVGERVHISELPYVRGHCKIHLGDGARISKLLVFSGRFYDEPELHIGAGATIGHLTSITVNYRVWIGDHAGIASRVTIADSDGHPVDLDRRLRGEPLSRRDIRPVTIGDHVWIGRGAHVQKGVTIGRGAVIAAGSVVISDVPEGALAMGVPARVLTRPWDR
ncbi:MAG: acyltransferase [Polyangiaceae bacterium]